MSMSEVEGILIPPTISTVAALRRMDETGEKILFVTDEERRLLGVVTDGDIRRLVLRGESLDTPISEAMNCSPHVVRAGFDVETAREVMLSQRVESLPVIDEQGRVVGAVRWIDLFEEARRERERVELPVVIMAGGEGTRLAPFTKVLPKPLVPVGDRPMVEHVMERFADAGCSEFYLSVNYKASLIKAYFADAVHPYEIRYLEEEHPLGTAGSLSLLAGRIDTPFFVSNCDILVDADYAEFYRFHREGEHRISLIASMKDFVVPYGSCEITNGGSLVRILEKPRYSLLVSTGLYLFEPDVLKEIPPNEHLHITDLMNACIARGESVGVYPVSEFSWTDMGQLEELQKMIDGPGTW